MTSQVLIALITSVIGPAVMVFLQQRTRREVQSVADRTDKAVAELTPNHGSSVKDQLSRIEAQQSEQGRALVRVETAQGQASRDIGGLREEIRTERDERLDLAGRVGALERRPRTRT
ncbi:hypothetical protein [Cellulomonas timonensis]|uniref:hypothetical protein n=1 Tax=Cellulomonas timonensis TaxID=1689271 RepID=UPI00082C6B66|nr:hypothetical protein [Cellulomonas timonensis]